MDIVQILRRAIDRLPAGDHSPGLSAIMRHISNAIRHFDRREEGESDGFTDAIYRTNQAYEGSLKEAYRVLAGKDPSKRTPNEIEKYLETKGVIRPRVLTQLTRYRNDYRNPSTHDYKLDFDEDEALLAIVSVCAFAKLLVDQISERLAFEAAAALAVSSNEPHQITDEESFANLVAAISLEYIEKADPSLSYSEFEGGLAGVLSGFGLDTDLNREADHLPGVTWDVFISWNGKNIPIEYREVSRTPSHDEPHSFSFLINGTRQSNYIAGIAMLRSASPSKYNLYKYDINGTILFVVARYTSEEIEDLEKQLKGKLAP